MDDNTIRSGSEIVAYHESAHAVIVYLLGYSIHKVAIDSEENSGICWWNFRTNVRQPIPEFQGIPEIEKRVIVDCAGYGSKSLLIGINTNWHRSSDYKHAVKELTPIYTRKIAKIYIESVTEWVKEILSKYWEVVGALADSLIWYPEKNRFDDWPGSDFEDLLPSDYFEAPEQWSMDGEQAEAIIQRALIAYGLAL